MDPYHTTTSFLYHFSSFLLNYKPDICTVHVKFQQSQTQRQRDAKYPPRFYNWTIQSNSSFYFKCGMIEEPASIECVCVASVNWITFWHIKCLSCYYGARLFGHLSWANAYFQTKLKCEKTNLWRDFFKKLGFKKSSKTSVLKLKEIPIFLEHHF